MEEKKFSSQHEWVAIKGEIARVGVTDYVQSMVGDVAFINLPKVGSDVARGQSVAYLESLKTAVDVHTPMSGIVRTVNTLLFDDPHLVNRDSENSGWLFELQMTNPQEKHDLMSREEYNQHCKGQNKG